MAEVRHVDLTMRQEAPWLVAVVIFAELGETELGRIGLGFIADRPELEGQWVNLMRAILKDQCERLGIGYGEKQH